MSRSPGALDGLRVVEQSDGVATAFAGRILCDLGAEVVLIEPPSGVSRRGADGIGPELVFYDAGKSSAVLDLDRDSGRRSFESLVMDCDLLLTDRPDIGAAAGDLAAEVLQRLNPAVTIVRVSPFGADGPYASFVATHLVQCALAGWAATCGIPTREPLQSGGELTALTAGAYAAIGALGTLLSGSSECFGDIVDVSTWESAITAAFCPTLMYEYRSELPDQNSSHATGPSFHIPCRGGYVGVNVLTDAQWELTSLFIDRPELAIDERYATASARAEHIAELEAILIDGLGDREAYEVFRSAQEWRLPYGLVVTPSQALELETHRDRRFFETRVLSDGRAVEIPRMPFLLTETPTRVGVPPTLDDHAKTSDDRRVRRGGASNTDRRIAPLDGVRIVDFTAFQAGPMVTLIAADLGAEVVKVEAVQRLDGWRGIGRGDPNPWETSGPFHWANRGKLGVTLNLADPRGLGLARRLIEEADVVIENFTPRVMRQHGLGYDELRRLRNDLVMVSMPGYGTVGPWSEYACFAYPAEQLSTISHQTGYSDSGPLFTGTPVCDVAAALMATNALLAALVHRRKTGSGQHIDVSQLESATSFAGEALLRVQLDGDESNRHGNEHPEASPHATYPCLDGRWIAIACRDDDDWLRMVGCFDASTRLRCRAEWRDLDCRLENRQELNAVVADWTRRRDGRALMHQLQREGVPAGLVMNGADMLVDEHLRARGFFVPHRGVESGLTHCPAQPFRFRDTPLAPTRNAPRVGQHNHLVLGELLGLQASELEELEASDVIGDRPLISRTI